MTDSRNSTHETRPDRIHDPVMLERSVEILAPALQRPGAVLVDATVGMGGHAEAFLSRFPRLALIGIDRDRDALTVARERLARFGDRVHLVHAIYSELAEILESESAGAVSGVLFDLGVSSLQLDRGERGFSYSKDAALDMRMDTQSSLTAQMILANYTESELRRIFRSYGEEKLAGRIARKIVEARDSAPIQRSAELVTIIEEATPAAVRRTGHPAKRIFQALRIEVNGELAALERALPTAIEAIEAGGRIVVLAYQSLEDRLVKRAFTAGATSTAPQGLPVELPEHRPILKFLVRGAEKASPVEVASNPRSASVRLRAVERVRSSA